MLRSLRLLASIMLVLTMLTVILPARLTQAADTTLMTEEEAIALLKEYNIVRGDPSGAINVNDKLTRAQAAAVFVRVLNMENLATLLPDVVPFTDARGHWAAGEIAMVERLGLMRGDGNGLFRPDDDITYVEVLTVLLRMVDQEPSGPWNPAAIIVMANRLGIAPPQVADLKVPAIRGKIFWSLAVTSSNIPVDESGTLLQKHLDATPPSLVLEKTTLTTPDDAIVIRGITEGASKVLVNDRPAQLDPKSGSFSYQAQVPVGQSTLVVKALDWAGNQTTASVSVNRQGVISRLRVTGPATVLARTSTKLTVEVKDSRGNDLPRDEVKVAMTGDVATFNLDTGTLTTGSKTGRGTLTLSAGSLRSTYTFDVLGPSASATRVMISSINSNRAPAVDQEVTVTVQVQDSDGRLVADDYGRTISLRSQGLAGITITSVKPVTEKGIATFKLKGARTGTASLEASSTGLDSDIKTIEILSSVRIALSSTVSAMKPDGTTTTIIRATLMDQNGRAMNNSTNQDIQIQLEATGTDGELIDDYIVIPRGRSNSSGSDGSYRAGIMAGTVVIRGTYLSSHDYSIQTLDLPVTIPLAGVKLQVTASSSSAEPGAQVTLTLKVLNSSNSVVNTGSYAFQIRISTSNNDPLVNGLPDGAELSFTNSIYTPVDDGRADTDPLNNEYSVVGRTINGTAQMTLKYNRSGSVTVTPVVKPSTYEGYHPSESFGPASASSNLTVVPVTVTFAGSPTKVLLTADSDLATDAAAAAVTSAKQIKVRAKVVDASGAVVPGYNQTVSLTRLSEGNGISSIVGISKKAAVNGVAEFTIQMSGTEGFDRYRASVGSLVSSDMTVALHKSKPEAPHIVAVRGIKEGDLSPETGYVGPEADYMDIQLLPQAAYLDDEPTNWVVAKVYKQGQSREFFRSEPINLDSPVPTIRIPKSLLSVGESKYEVVVNNGAGDSIRSPTLDDTSKAMNAVYYSGYRLTSATYDATLGKLTLSGSGLVSNGLVDTSKIRVTKGDSTIYLGGDQVTVQSVSSSSIVLLLGDMAASIDPDVFYGTVTVVAETGWFASSNGSQIAQPQTVGVTPMATITYASVDAANKYLYLYGDGLRQGTLTPGLLSIHGIDDSVTLNTANDKIKSTTDSLITLTLSSSTLEAIMLLQGPLHVTAEAGWLKTSTGKVGAIAGSGHQVYLQAKVMSGSYDPETNTLTLRGNGFLDATLNPAKLSIRRTTGSGTWTPATTAPVLGEAEDTIAITFSEADAAAFETQFLGKNIYVNTQEGWLVDDLNREALTVPSNSVLFQVPSN